MLSSPEQLAAATRAQLATQLNLATALTDSMIVSMEKFVGLNLQATKATVDSSVTNAQHLLTLKDPQELLSATQTQAQPQADIAATYARHLTSIATNTHLELSKAVETQLTESSRHLVSMLDEIGKMAPAGSEGAMSMMKSAIDNVSSGYAQLNRSTKVAIEAMELNLNAAGSQLNQIVTKTTGRAAKK